MPLIHEDYGYYTYLRTARRLHRCTHWRHLGFMDGYECGAPIEPGERYVESVAAPYSDSPYYRVLREDPMQPWRETGRKITWGRVRFCGVCAQQEFRSFPEVRALSSAALI